MDGETILKEFLDENLAKDTISFFLNKMVKDVTT